MTYVPVLMTMALAMELAAPLDEPRPTRISGDPVPMNQTGAVDDGLVIPTSPQLASRGVVFLNFEGATLTFGQDDARSDITVLEDLAGPFPAYGGTTQRAATLQSVQTDFAAYDMLIVDARPTAGSYTMAMIGPLEAGTVLGVAPLDCRDQFPNNIVFAFHGDGDGYTASAQANTISQEIAHSYGLEHVDQMGDIMYPVSSGGDPGFLDACFDVVPAPEIVCGDQHADHCPAGQQNSHRELLQRFGPVAPPDPASMAITLTAPDDGDEIDVDEPFDIVAASIDGRPFANVVLFVDEANIGGRTQSPFTWRVEGLAAGVYEAYVIGIEASGAMSRSDTIEIFVGVDNPDRDDSDGCHVAGPTPGRGHGRARLEPWLGLVLVGPYLIRRRRARRRSAAGAPPLVPGGS